MFETIMQPQTEIPMAAGSHRDSLKPNDAAFAVRGSRTPGPCDRAHRHACPPAFRTPVGVKVYGTDLAEIEKVGGVARQIEAS